MENKEKAANVSDLYGDSSDVSNSVIDVPRQIDIYKNLDITPKDKYIVSINGNSSAYDLSEVRLINSEEKLCTMRLVPSSVNGEYFLTALSRNLNKFTNSKNIRYKLAFKLRGDCNFNIERNISVNVHETETTDAFLCIDFGTSNSSAGVFLSHDYISNLCNSAVTNGTVKPGDENIVCYDMNGNGEKFADIVPTIVSCINCHDAGNIVYKFGYDAYNDLKKNNYCPTGSVFMEIKRWVTDCDKTVRMLDPDGNIVELKRRDIIREYLLYLIGEAQQQFKCFFKNLHISAPVKLKNEYLKVFSELLPKEKYHLELDKAIDEGAAVLYSQISEDIRQVKNDNSKSIEKKALIIDCGGGTSDLSSCRYHIGFDDDIIDVEMDTSYINGDFNFGGNNLTYRIMQYMKVVYAHFYTTATRRKKDRRLLIESLLKENVTNIISKIESADSDAMAAQAYKDIYAKLEEEYDKAEAVIPTKFSLYETDVEEKYNSIRNNFYFLWNMADQMKKKFYQYDTISRYTINKDDSDKDSDLYINPIPMWKLTVCVNGEFRKESYPEIVFNAKEIGWLMTGDIYYLVHRFLHGLYDTGELNEFQSIKLSGQSTNIDTFKNGLKEFLPGKKLSINPDPTENPFELKLICLKGMLRYIYALHSSDIDVRFNNSITNIPFDVVIPGEKSVGKERIMIYSSGGWNQPPQKIRVVPSGMYKNLYFRSAEGTVMEKPLRFEFASADVSMKEMPIKEIEKTTDGHIDQNCLDELNSEKYYLLTYANEKLWGFNILMIFVDKNGRYLVSDPVFYSFQTEINQHTFFDGKS